MRIIRNFFGLVDFISNEFEEKLSQEFFAEKIAEKLKEKGFFAEPSVYGYKIYIYLDDGDDLVDIRVSEIDGYNIAKEIAEELRDSRISFKRIRQKVNKKIEEIANEETEKIIKNLSLVVS